MGVLADKVEMLEEAKKNHIAPAINHSFPTVDLDPYFLKSNEES